MRKPAPNSLSPLRWPGGKTEWVPTLMRLLGVVDGYCEPFSGGGSTALTIRRRLPWASVWMNDADPCVVDFFTMLRDYPNDMQRRVRKLWRGFAGFAEAIEFFSGILPVLRSDRLDAMQRAAAFYLCNRLGYAGMTHHCGATGSTSRRINDRQIDSLPFWSAALNGTRITGMDYRDVLSVVGPKHVLYLDPPYEHGNGACRDIYWGRPWAADDLLELAEQLVELDRRGVRWVTSLMMSGETEAAFLGRLRGGCKRVNVSSLLVKHVLVRRTAEERLIWNFAAR